MNSAASVAAPISSSRSLSRISRIRSPTGVPPGSRSSRCARPFASSQRPSRATWVDFPAPSGPSTTSSSPRLVPVTARSAEGDDRAGRALLDPVDDPVVHLHHHLVVVLLRDDEPLVSRVLLHLAEQGIEVVLHLLARPLPALDHLLRAGAERLHLPQQVDRFLVTGQRVVGALHRLVFAALADQPAELLRLVVDHRAPGCAPLGA